MTRIDDTTARYHALLFGDHLEGMRGHLARAVEANLAVDECRVLRPYFIEAQRYGATLEATALLNDAVIAAARRLRDDQALRRSLGIPAYLDELIRLDHANGAPAVMARIDGLFDPAGVYRMIEYNAQPEFGPARAIDDMFAASPIASAFARETGFQTQQLDDYAVDGVLAACGDHGKATIGVPQGNARARDWLAHAEARGCRVSYAPYERYRFEQSRLVVDSQTIDVIALPWRDLAAPTDAMKPILDAVRSGAVRTLDGLALGLLASYKHTLELLSDPSHASMFAPNVAAALAKHMPWTRVVRERKTSFNGRAVDLLPFLASNRERMVLKPSGGARGEGVMIGRLCDAATWTKTLSRAVKQPYIAQEWVAGETAPYPPSTGDSTTLVNATSDFNPFVWNGNRVRGCQVRLTTTGKHAPDEAWVTAVWVIDA